MIILVHTQSLGRRKAVQPVPMELSASPQTVRDLILLCVESCVKRQQRLQEAPLPLSGPRMDELAQIGKITFGLDQNGTAADLDKARENALQSYRDGLFRVFMNGRELGGLDTPIAVQEDDVFTFIRLVMLAGSGW